MPKFGELQKPFLTADQQLWVDHYEGVADDLEFPEDGLDEEIIDGLSHLVLSEYSDGLLEHIELESYVPKTITSYQELEAKLQWFAQKDRFLAANFKAIGKLAAMGTGAEVALSGEDSMEALYGYEFGYTMIRLRAQRDLGSLLVANYELRQARHTIEGDASVWYRAIVAHQNNPRVKPPVSIDTEEAKRIGILERKALESFSSATSPVKLVVSDELNASRLHDFNLQAEVELNQDPDSGTFEQLSSLTEKIKTQGIPDYSDSEVNEGFRKIHRVKLYLLSAIKGNATIASDPRSRYFLYLTDNLSVSSLYNRFAEYDREASKYTMQQEQAMLSGPSNEA